MSTHPVLASLDEPKAPAPAWLFDLAEWMKPCVETGGVCRRYSTHTSETGWGCIDCDRDLPPVPSERVLVAELLRTREALRYLHSLPKSEAA